MEVENAKYRKYENKNAAEVREVAADLKKRISQEEYKLLMKPVGIKSCASFALDWAAVLLSAFAVWKMGALAAPIAILVIGSRQRALSNLVHDASHGNLFSNRKVNDAVANILGAYPMLDTVEVYRKSHMDHHRHLGSLEHDPDSKSHLRYGYNDNDPTKASAWWIYRELIFNFSSWKDSNFGSLLSLGFRAQLNIFVSNLFLMGAVALIVGTEFTITLGALWVLARATSYHVIRLFAEFLDHAGLEQGTVLSFTRNLPHNGLLAQIFHPHEDTYHLIHHLLPKIPHYKLAEAHEVLNQNEKYRSAHHCDSYFSGNHTALSCLEGCCKGRVSA